MKNICFIGAMSAELSYLESFLGDEKTSYYKMVDEKRVDVKEENVIYLPSQKLGSSIIHACEINTGCRLMVLNEYENNIATLNTGVGLLNAYLAGLSIDKNKYEYFINIGTAGALDESLKKGDIFSIDSAYLDKDNKFYFLNMPYIKNFQNGCNLSIDKFADKAFKKKYSNYFKERKVPMKTVDMELYALRSSIPELLSFKIISDEVNECSEDFKKNFGKFINEKYNPGIEKIIKSIE
jgi:hypothetical protein